MGTIFNSWIAEKDGNLGNWDFTDELTCDDNEEYMLAPVVRASMQLTYEDGVTVVSARALTTAGNGARCAGYVDVISGYQYHIGLNNDYNNSYNITVDGSTLAWAYNPWTGTSQSFPEIGRGVGNRQNCTGYFTTNIPIFETLEEAQEYTRASDIDAKILIKNALNYKGPTSYDNTTNEFFINEQHSHYTVENGIVSAPAQQIFIRAERILYNGDRICLYRGSNNKFELTLITGADLLGSKYSNSSFNELLTIPYSEFTLNHLEYTTPFYSPYSTELDTPNYEGYLATMFSTNIPIFDSVEKAQKYLNGEIDVTQSENWKNISNSPVWKNVIKNTTGDEEITTDMGEVFAQNYFSQLYLCASAGINQIASSLYDVGIGSLSGLWDEIKKGVEMYGDDPMQSVQGLMFFPLDLSSVYQNVQDQNYVYFGGYKLDLQTTVKKIIFANGYKSLGTITIRKSFNDWRDYEPYTKLYIYLPYVGTFQLQLARYYGKSTEIRYYFDLRTGSCLVALLANGKLTDYFNGQIGVQLPITLTDKSAYANSQVNTLLKGASSIGSVVADVSAGVAGGASIPITGAFGALQAGVSVTKTVYDLTQNNKTNYNKTTGGSTSMLNEFLPQYPYFIFEIQKTIDTDNLEMLQGYPSNESGNVGKFSGYLEVESVNLICGTATDNEKRQITQALYNGIII